MGVITSKSFDQPDEVVSAPNVRKRIVSVGKTSIAHIEYAPGWRWSKDIKPIAKTFSCQFHHRGVVASGHLHVTSDEGGAYNLGPGDAFDIPPGHDAWTVGDEPCVMIEFNEARDWGKPMHAGERILATLLITDIVGSTAAAVRLGDAAWKQQLSQHYDSVRLQLDRFRGIEVDTAGDGFLSMFDGAARAVQCAAAIRGAARQDGVEIRAGIHSGEVERPAHGGNLVGVAVHIAARIAALAQPGEILLSASTSSILEGSGLSFTDAGEHELKGLEQRRRLFRLNG